MLATFHSRVRAATQTAIARPLDPILVRGHLLASPRPAEVAFARAWELGLEGLKPAERHGGMNAVTGHVAESVAATLLVDAGWHVLEQFSATASGGHGIDLAMLTPDASSVFVVEVKGSLRVRGWPRLTLGDLAQFSLGWLDKLDNPGMASLQVSGDDVMGLVVLINFARREWKAISTPDFEDAIALTEEHDIGRPSDWF